jgi:hypothetical protein
MTIASSVGQSSRRAQTLTFCMKAGRLPTNTDGFATSASTIFTNGSLGSSFRIDPSEWRAPKGEAEWFGRSHRIKSVARSDAHCDAVNVTVTLGMPVPDAEQRETAWICPLQTSGSGDEPCESHRRRGRIAGAHYWRTRTASTNCGAKRLGLGA